MSGKPWTEEENNIIKENYGKISAKEIAKMLPGRNADTVFAQAMKLGLTNNKKNPWTPEEDEIVKKNYYALTIEELAKLLPRHPLSSVAYRPYKLGLDKKIDSKPWSDNEVETLVLNYPNESVSQLAKRIPGRSIESINGKIRQLGLRKKGEDTKPYTQEEIDYLLAHYGKDSILEIAKKLNDRSYQSIVSKAHSLGLAEKKLWAKDEDEIIRDFYPKETAEEVSKRLTNRTPAAVRIRASQLNVTKISRSKVVDEINSMQNNHQKELEELIEQHQKELEKLNAIHQEELERLKKEKRKTKKIHVRKKEKNTNTIWTKEEDEIVKELYFKEDLGTLAKKISNHSPKEIKKRAKKLGLVADKTLEKWKPKDIDVLKEFYPIEGTAVFYRLKRFSLNSIKSAAKKLKIKSNRITEPWAYKEDLLACEYYLKHVNDWNKKEVIDELLDIFISNGYLNHKQKTLHMKLANCSYIHTGIGLEHASKQNIKAYDKLTGNNRLKRLLVKIIRFLKKVFK